MHAVKVNNVINVIKKKKKVNNVNLFFSQIMCMSLNPHNSCMCVIIGDSGIYGSGNILFTWMYFYQGKKNIHLLSLWSLFGNM